MGITTGLQMTSPLTIRPRKTFHVDEALLERVKNDRSGHVASHSAWEAMVAGDRPALRAIATAFLASSSTAPTGIRRDRWFLMGAAAHADQVEIRCVADLRVFLESMLDGLVLMQMATMDFGSRRDGVLESPAVSARRRIELTIEAVDRLVTPGEARPWEVVANLSYFGDLLLSSAVARALRGAGDTGDAYVVLAAHLRHRHNHPEKAVELCERIITNGTHPWALNNLAGSLGDLAEFTKAAEYALLSIAVLPNKHSGNTGRRAFRNIGRADLAEMSDEIAIRAKLDDKPKWFSGSISNYTSVLAANLLHTAGRRDLAELQLSRHRSTADWARVTRLALDSGHSSIETIKEALT
jgi:hypothetical protein